MVGPHLKRLKGQAANFKTLTDGAGRAFKVIFADNSYNQSFFNNQGQLIAQRDPDAVFTARTELRARIGDHLAASLFDHYRRLSESRPYTPDAAGAGRRALRNTCLSLLVATRRRDAISLAARQ